MISLTWHQHWLQEFSFPCNWSLHSGLFSVVLWWVPSPPPPSRANIWIERKDLTQRSFLRTRFASFATSSLDTVQLGAFPVFQEEFLVLTQGPLLSGVMRREPLLCTRKYLFIVWSRDQRRPPLKPREQNWDLKRDLLLKREGTSYSRKAQSFAAWCRICSSRDGV